MTIAEMIGINPKELNGMSGLDVANMAKQVDMTKLPPEAVGIVTAISAMGTVITVAMTAYAILQGIAQAVTDAKKVADSILIPPTAAMVVQEKASVVATGATTLAADAPKTIAVIDIPVSEA